MIKTLKTKIKCFFGYHDYNLENKITMVWEEDHQDPLNKKHRILDEKYRCKHCNTRK